MAFKKEKIEKFINEGRGEIKEKKEKDYSVASIYLRKEEKEILKELAKKKRMPLGIYIKDVLFNKNDDLK